MLKAAAKIIISGYVQGVGYRFFAQDEAKIFEIKGYVRNVREGKVEVFAEGTKENIEKFIERLKQGPFGSVVANVEVDWVDYKNQYNAFDITF